MAIAAQNPTHAQSLQLLEILENYVRQVWNVAPGAALEEAYAEDDSVYASVIVDEDSDTLAVYWDEDEEQFLLNIRYNEIDQDVDYYVGASTIEAVTFDAIDKVLAEAIGMAYHD